MKPPQHLIDAMLLQDGQLGVLISTLCLGAALALRDGRSTDLTDIQSNRPIPDDLREMIRSAHARIVEELRDATREQLDEAIALYSAHLKAAGYTFTAGQDN
jgi:hypothetical protein